MDTQREHRRHTHVVSRRELLQAGLAAGAALSAWPLYSRQALWGGEAGSPKPGGILRVHGWDPPHFDRFLTEKANPLRVLLDPVDRVEVVDRYTVKFLLKEPFVWLVETLARPSGTWIIAPEVVDTFGDLRRPETAIGTGPFMLERYE